MSNEYQKKYQRMNKKDVNARLKDAEERWKKEIQENHPREPFFIDRFFNVPSTNPLYWDANTLVTKVFLGEK